MQPQKYFLLDGLKQWHLWPKQWALLHRIQFLPFPKCRDVSHIKENEEHWVAFSTCWPHWHNPDVYVVTQLNIDSCGKWSLIIRSGVSICLQLMPLLLQLHCCRKIAYTIQKNYTLPLLWKVRKMQPILVSQKY